MKHLTTIFLFILLTCSTALAVTSAGERNIDMLTQGGPVSIRDASKNIYRSRETDTYVLDVLAEVVLKNSSGNLGQTMTDAIAWGCKALGQSGNPRYRTTLEQVIAQSSSSKLRKYAQQSLGLLGGGDVEQYMFGGVNLEEARVNASVAAEEQREQVEQNVSNTDWQPITVVKVGMSMQEVIDLVGLPNATTNYQTGKAFIPFNFKGGDLVRTVGLYKNQGRIVYTNRSNYDSTLRVIEIQINPNESGYP